MSDHAPRPGARLLAALPPLAAAAPAPAVVDRFSNYYQATLGGASLVDSLRSKKAFDNPYALEEVINTFGIDDKSSAYPPAKWDPLKASPQDFADVLRVKQALEEEKRQEALRAAGPRAAISFKAGGFLLADGGGVGGLGAGQQGGGGGGAATVPKKSRFG